MDVAIIGATGSCGRQVAAQLADRGVLAQTSHLHLIGHAGGQHESELWGLRADLRDAFADRAPQIEVGTDVATTNADLVVLMAGATVSRENADRAALAAANRLIFTEAAEAIGAMSPAPTVVVQSNPVELAIQTVGAIVPRQQILGAAAWSDSLRFRRELAADLGVNAALVQAQMWGQHGDHLVPMWSLVRARGVGDQQLADVIGAARGDRNLSDLPAEIRAARGRVLDLVSAGDVVGSYSYLQQQPPDIRAAVKPFFTHFTAGRTTELATAHAVVDIVEFLVQAQPRVVPAQVQLQDDPWGINGIAAVNVLLDHRGWSQEIPHLIAPDERAALQLAAQAIRRANRG